MFVSLFYCLNINWKQINSTQLYLFFVSLTWIYLFHKGCLLSCNILNFSLCVSLQFFLSLQIAFDVWIHTNIKRRLISSIARIELFFWRKKKAETWKKLILIKIASTSSHNIESHLYWNFFTICNSCHHHHIGLFRERYELCVIYCKYVHTYKVAFFIVAASLLHIFVQREIIFVVLFLRFTCELQKSMKTIWCKKYILCMIVWVFKSTRDFQSAAMNL